MTTDRPPIEECPVRGMINNRIKEIMGPVADVTFDRIDPDTKEFIPGSHVSETKVDFFHFNEDIRISTRIYPKPEVTK